MDSLCVSVFFCQQQAIKPSLFTKTRSMKTTIQPPTTTVPDLLSFDSWGNETMAMTASSETLSSASSLGGDADQHDVPVSISGVIFTLDPSTFDKLRKLPWKPSDAEDESAAFSLSTSPELFDVLVHHVLFGTLPPAMAEHDMEELEIMALSLGLQSLAQHVSNSQPTQRRSFLRRQTSCPMHKTSAVRSWASMKRWSSTGRLVVQKKMETAQKRSKKTFGKKDAHPATHLVSATRHLA